MVKRKLVILLIQFFILNSILFTSKKEFPIYINLRISNDSASLLKIEPGDLKLFVNKKSTPVNSVRKINRSFGSKELLGRNFILSTGNFSKYEKKLSSGISYLVTEILTPSDSLILVTGDNIHQIKISRNKGKIINNIEDILSLFFEARSRQQSIISEDINLELQRLKNYFESYDPANRIVSEGLLYSETLTKLTTEIDFFKQNFISPTKKGAKKVSELLGLRQGHRYWIHIQNSKLYPFSKQLQYSLKWIKYHMSMTTNAESSWQKVVSSKLHTLEQVVIISDVFPSISLSRIFVDSNISFFTSLIKSNQKSEGIFSKLTADIENVFHSVTKKSGGTFVESKNSESGIRNMKNHIDTFFRIEFNTGIIPRKVNLKLKFPGGYKNLYYRKFIDIDSFIKLFKDYSSERVKLGLFKLKKGVLSFEVSSFSRSKKERIGLIKAVLKVKDSNKEIIYKTSNILRTVKPKIHVDVRIPVKFRKSCIFRLDILDMISNRAIRKELTVK